MTCAHGRDGITNNHRLPADNHTIGDMCIQHIKLGPLIGRHGRGSLQRLIRLRLRIDKAACLGHGRTSRVLLVVDAVPTPSDITAGAAIETFLPGVGCLDAPVVQLHHFNWHAGAGALDIIGNDHFLQHHFVVLEIFGTGTAHH